MLTIYDASCSHELGKGVMQTYLYKESAVVQVSINNSVSNHSEICYTLVPLGNTVITNASSLRLFGDSQTERPAAQPLYAY